VGISTSLANKNCGWTVVLLSLSLLILLTPSLVIFEFVVEPEVVCCLLLYILAVYILTLV